MCLWQCDAQPGQSSQHIPIARSHLQGPRAQLLCMAHLLMVMFLANKAGKGAETIPNSEFYNDALCRAISLPEEYLMWVKHKVRSKSFETSQCQQCCARGEAACSWSNPEGPMPLHGKHAFGTPPQYQKAVCAASKKTLRH